MLSGKWAKEHLKGNKSPWRFPGGLGSKKKVLSTSVMENVRVDRVKFKPGVEENTPNPWTLAVSQDVSK